MQITLYTSEVIAPICISNKKKENLGGLVSHSLNKQCVAFENI